MDRSVARARQAVAVLANPALRAAVVGDGVLDDRARAAVSAFDWLGTTRSVSEAVLNAGVAMFAEDVAIVRRDAVDLGVLDRTPDGMSYRFVPR